jgi:hypothetical protein
MLILCVFIFELIGLLGYTFLSNRITAFDGDFEISHQCIIHFNNLVEKLQNIKNKQNELIQCDCGNLIRKVNKARHQKTKIHQEGIKSKV